MLIGAKVTIGPFVPEDYSAMYCSANNGGQGYGKEAMKLALDNCWRHLNLNRVGLIVFRNNPRAVSVYEVAGFRIEGCFKNLFGAMSRTKLKSRLV
jgi:RimJ/RimL family protein N-acetyltransferase